MLAQIIWKLKDFLLFRKGKACGSSYTFRVVPFDPSFPHGKGKAEPRVYIGSMRTPMHNRQLLTGGRR